MIRRSRSLDYGLTHYFSSACVTGIYGDLQVSQEEGEAVLKGFTPAITCTPANLSHYTGYCQWLYRAPELDTTKGKTKLELYKIREMIRLQTTEMTSTTVTNSYNIEKAVNEFRQDVVLAETSGMLGSNYGATAVMTDIMEKRMRNRLTSTYSTTSTRQCVGEDLIMLEKGCAVFCENKLVGICLPRGFVDNVFLSYQLKEPIRIKEVMADIPKSQELCGRVTAFDSQKIIPNHYATVDYVIQYLGKYLPPLNLEQSLPDKNLDPMIWRYWIRRRFLQENGRVWNQKDCNKLVEGEKKGYSASPATLVKMALNVAVLFFTLWSVLSISNLLPEPVQFDLATSVWNNMTPFGKKDMTNYEFRKESYSRYVNSGKDANVGGYFDQCSGIFQDKILWVNNLEGLHEVTRDGEKLKSNWIGAGYFYGDKAMPVLEVEDYIFAVCRTEEGQSFACFYDTENLDAEPVKVAEGWSADYEEEGVLSFDKTAEKLYGILVKQEKEKISPEEMAGLLYFSARGMLLNYEDGKAFFISTDTEAGTLGIYQQTKPGEREHLATFSNEYAGVGTGRFMADGSIYFAEKQTVVQYDPETRQGVEHHFGEDEQSSMEQPDILAMNYLYTPEGELVIACMRQDDTALYRPETKRLTPLAGNSEDGQQEYIYVSGNILYFTVKAESTNEFVERNSHFYMVE